MRVLNYLKISLVITVLTLLGCEDFFDTTIDIDPPSYEKKLVLLGRASAGDTAMVLRFSENIGILENDTTAVYLSGVNTTVYLNGASQKIVEFKENSSFGFVSKYKVLFDRRLQSNDSISIEANYQSLPPISTSAIIPSAPTIKKISYQIDGGINQENEEISKVEVSYQSNDAFVYTAAYAESLIVYCTNWVFEDGMDKCLSFDTSLNTNLIEIQDPDAAYGIFLKKDNKTKQAINLTTTFSQYIFDDGWGDQDTMSKFITFETYNKESYEYLISARNYDNSIDNPFSTPVNVKSNINDGYGVFLVTYRTMVKL